MGRKRKCKHCKTNLELKDFCYECNQKIEEVEYECPKCYSRFDEDGEEI